ncbi:uncharacterized protein LOC132748798 [Ruditapes philippinarum]|uniref:uncharacterized protein LOC132748798 n=1 Tax=Ruditapes philippinarum TaxID=129788 RepID=UPI00295BA4F8|nr:uncharacterized protein LOC132748798 [Ruditapes philippinarum]
MGAGAGKPSEKVDLECDPSDTRISVLGNSANKTSNEFTVPTNTLVSGSRIIFTKKTKIKIKFKGGGVLRIGLTSINPSDNENILEGSVFEKEEGFSSGKQEAVRILYKTEYSSFRYGPEGDEIENDCENIAANLWLYVIHVYGTPDVEADLIEEEDRYEKILLCSARSGHGSSASIASNTARCRFSKPVVPGDVYHCHWDMKLLNENIAEKPPSHGFMSLKLVSRNINKGSPDEEDVIWERSSAVQEYPFSSVIAFRLSLHERQVSHNLFVSSVGNTTKDVFSVEGKLDPDILYFEIEFSSGEIQVTHGRRLIIAQELGSTILISGYQFDDEEATIDEAITEIRSKIDFKPRRLQYGNSPSSFVLEFNEKITDQSLKDIQINLRCKVQRIYETKSVQVLLNGADNKNDVKYFLEAHFTRPKAGGGSIKSIEFEKNIPGCWVINFEKSEIARNFWMKNKYRINIDEQYVKALVQPMYKELGLSVNGGKKPTQDLTPLVVDVDKNKLRFIKSRNAEKKSFVGTLNKNIKVDVCWEEQEHTDEFEGEDQQNPVAKETSITFKYSGSKSDWKETANWKDITKRVVSNYFKTAIYELTFNCDDDITDQLNDLRGQYEFEYEEDLDNNDITLYGSNESTLKEVAKKSVTKVLFPELVDKPLEITVPKYLALDAEGILNNVKTDCRFTSFKVNTETGKITLTGPKDEVQNARLCILQFALQLKSVELLIEEEHVMFLQKGGLEQLKEQFRKENLNHNLTLSEKRNAIIVLTYIENEDIEKKKNKMLDVIGNFIKTIEICVDKEEPLNNFATAQWKQYKGEIIEKANGLVVIFEPAHNSTIKIIGTDETVKVAKVDVDNYLKGHKLGTVMMRVPVEIAMYLDEFKGDNIRDDIECGKDSNGLYTGKLSLKCSSDDISRLHKSIEKNIQEIKQHWFVMKEKWIASVIQDLVDLKTLSHNERFLLDAYIGHSLAAYGITGISVFSKIGTIIQVKRGDITFETTAAIVHSTNGHVKAFEKGIGKCLQNIGGTEIRDELLRAIEERRSKIGDILIGHINADTHEEKVIQGQDNEVQERNNKPSNSGFKNGDLVLTESGQLRCLKVIHVFPPRWIDGKQSEEKEMKTLVRKILQTCQDNKLASVSLSAIGCGAGKYPHDKATSYIVEAVADYVENNKETVIKEIVLCDSSETAVKKFTEALGKLKSSHWVFFEHGKPLQVDDFLTSSIRKAENKLVIRPSSGRAQLERPRTGLKWRRENAYGFKRVKQHDINRSTSNEEMNDLFKDGLPYKIPISDNMNLHVVRADLTKQKVDAIVNTTSEFPNLTGEISKAILNAGGNTIRQECQNLDTISEGEVKSTGAGLLKCKKLIHAKIPMRWDSQNGEKFVSDLISRCLAEAISHGYSSIAFPTIGTGHSGFPADKVANAMVKSICEIENDKCPLKDIFIVVYSLDDGICKIFEDVVPHCFNSVASHGTGMTISKKGSKMTPKHKTVRYVSPPSFDKHSEIDDVVVFKIVSKTSGEKIQKKIQDIVKHQLKEETLNFQELSNEKTLTEVEERTLKTLEMSYGVNIEIDKKSKLVKISGLSDRVSECHFKAVELLRDTFPKMRLKSRNIKTIAETVQWYYGDADGNSLPVDVMDNYEIHMQYLHGNDFTYENQSENKTYKVLINDLMEHPIDDPRKKRRLYLRTKVDENIPLPDNWTIALDENKKMDQIKLKESDAEFNDVKDKFIRGGCKPKKIESISRLENKFLWQQYQTKKKQIESQNPKIQNERQLWHGTDVDTVPKIVKHGYNRSFTTVCAYGLGAYFAVQSAYSDSDRYAKPDVNGVKRMFLNRVLVGVSCLGNSSMAVLPQRPGVTFNNFPVCYDSAADSNGKTPGIYVIFHDTQAYPEYLIEYS